jgi:hypothetical protein
MMTIVINEDIPGARRFPMNCFRNNGMGMKYRRILSASERMTLNPRKNTNMGARIYRRKGRKGNTFLNDSLIQRMDRIKTDENDTARIIPMKMGSLAKEGSFRIIKTMERIIPRNTWMPNRIAARRMAYKIFGKGVSASMGFPLFSLRT